MVGRWLLGLVAGALMSACGSPEPQTPGRFGEITSAVVIVNPVINQGSTTSHSPGAHRIRLEVAAADLEPVRTDDTGLALVEGLPTGAVQVSVEGDAVTLNVAAENELYDVVIAHTDSGAQHVIPPVRYPISGTVVHVAPGESINAAAATDGAIILLAPGRYPGNVEVRSDNVLIFGAWSEEDGPLSIIEGDISVLGGRNRIRGVDLEGTLSSNANDFSLAFSRVRAATISGNGVSLLRNTFTQGSASVPSSNAVLVDNVGIP